MNYISAHIERTSYFSCAPTYGKTSSINIENAISDSSFNRS